MGKKWITFLGYVLVSLVMAALSPCFALPGVEFPNRALTSMGGSVGVYVNPWDDTSYSAADSFNLPGIKPLEPISAFLAKPSTTVSSIPTAGAYATTSISGNTVSGTFSVELNSVGPGNFYAAGGAAVTCTTCLGGTLRQSLSSSSQGWRTTIPGGQTQSLQIIPAGSAFTAQLQYGSSGSPAHLSPSGSSVSGSLNWTYVEAEDPLAIVRDRRSIEFPAVLSNKMIASFKPKNSLGEPVALDCLAKTMGFDHFNWKQTITVPEDLRIEEWYGFNQDGSPKTGIDLGKTFNDPPHGIHPSGWVASRQFPGASWQPDKGPYRIKDTAYTFSNDYGLDPNTLDVAIDLNDGGSVADNLEPYLNELGQTQLTVKGQTKSPFEFGFIDAPHFPRWEGSNGEDFRFIKFGEKLSFRTELVGVSVVTPETSPTGYSIRVHELGVGFRWTSTSSFLWQQADLQGTFAGGDSNLPSQLEGGISDVEFFAVPEPSGFFLFCGCFLVYSANGLLGRSSIWTIESHR